MSVALFSADELANAAAYLANVRDTDAEDLRGILTDLATWSSGNIETFNAQYRESEQAVTRGEIAASMTIRHGGFVCDRERARGSLRLLRYNGVSNNAVEIDTPEYVAALMRIMERFAFRLLGELEIRERRAA